MPEEKKKKPISKFPKVISQEYYEGLTDTDDPSVPASVLEQANANAPEPKVPKSLRDIGIVMD